MGVEVSRRPCGNRRCRRVDEGQRLGSMSKDGKDDERHIE